MGSRALQPRVKGFEQVDVNPQGCLQRPLRLRGLPTDRVDRRGEGCIMSDCLRRNAVMVGQNPCCCKGKRLMVILTTNHFRVLVSPYDYPCRAR